MTELGITALRAENAAVLDIARNLTAEEWALPSDCEGWRVQDVVAHLANTFRAVAEPAELAPGVAGDLEATQAAQAEALRDWTPEQVLADYERLSATGIEMLAGFQAPGMAEAVIPMEDAGKYPLHLVANAFAFDHYCHLRNDILQPGGPIARPVPDSDEVRVGATLEWLLAGLPQMSAAALRGTLKGPLGLRLTGPGGGTWTVQPPEGTDAEALATVVEGVDDEVRAEVTSPGTEFIIWATGRRPWRDRAVVISGDEDYAAEVLDSVKLF